MSRPVDPLPPGHIEHLRGVLKGMTGNEKLRCDVDRLCDMAHARSHVAPWPARANVEPPRGGEHG